VKSSYIFENTLFELLRLENYLARYYIWPYRYPCISGFHYPFLVATFGCTAIFFESSVEAGSGND